MNEVPVIPLKVVDKTLKVKRVSQKTADYREFRPVLSRSLPLCFTGATPPRPCPGHVASQAAGVANRFGSKPPVMNRRLKRKFVKFVRLWLKHNIQPLAPDEIPTFDEWLNHTPYSAGRKAELRRVYYEHSERVSRREARRVKSFVKDETYPSYKYPRLINSRIDRVKVLFGPIVQAVSDRLFSMDWFIKKVPVPDRPQVIKDTLLSFNNDYIFTDYTAYEAHFSTELMETLQFQLFRHMLSKTNNLEWIEDYEAIVGGTNSIIFKYWSVNILAKRMSGEMDTSLSNGFSNLMTFLFCCFQNNARKVRGFVEGDDGLFVVTPRTAAPTAQQFEELGLTIKIGVTDVLSEASFCGQVYDMEDLVVVTDPLEALARVGWSGKRYALANHKTAMQLLRARGYSFVYQYAGCPLLDSLGRRILDLTQGVVIEERIFAALDEWERARLRAAVNSKLPVKVIGANTRALVEKLYHISPSQQILQEQIFSNIELGLHELPFQDLCHRDWVDYYDRYSHDLYDTNPCWLDKSENNFLQLLAKIPNYSKLVRILGMWGA